MRKKPGTRCGMDSGNRKTGRIGRGMMAAALISALAAFPCFGTNADLGSAKEKASSIEEEKKKVEDTLKSLEGLKADTAAYVSGLDENMAALETELSQLEVQINEKNLQVEKTREELELAEETQERQYQSMKLRIRYMYEKGETEFLDLLFQASDLSQLLNRAEYIQKISEYDRRKLDEYIQTKTEVADKKTGLETEQAELLALQETTLAKRDSVETLLQEKTRELRSYESKIASAEAQIDEYEEDLKAQEAMIQQIEAEIKRKEEEARKAAEAAGKTYNTASIGNIKFIWPCPASSRITSSFGSRSSPTEGASTDHKGIDIGAATGSNILAAASGEVTIATYSYSAGNYIMINHGGGVYTVYMHCSQLLASVGDQVSQGQVIAKVGSTGYSTGPHLHFGIRVNGSYVNPASYVSP